MAATITIRNDEGLRAVRRMNAALDESRWQPVVERSAVKTIKDHFLMLERTRANKRGWPRSHYWLKTSKGVSSSRKPGQVTVAVNEVGFRLHLEGGTVRPGRNPSWVTGRPTQWLTIPARAEAYGFRSKEFANLEFVKFSKTSAALVAKEGGVKPAEGRRMGARATKLLTKQNPLGTVFFWLVKERVVRPDPTVLPSEQVLAGAIRDALRDQLQAVWDRGHKGGTR